MKNKLLFALLVLSLFFSFSIPKTSQAGLLVGAANGYPVAGVYFGVAGGLIWMSFVEASLWDECNTSFCNDAFWFSFLFYPTVSMVLLDANSASVNLKKNEALISNTLKKELPFIDNSEVMGEIASLFQEKLIQALSEQPHATQLMVHFSDVEINRFLSFMDLNQFQKGRFTEILR